MGVAGHVTRALSDLNAVLPHMRAVAAAASGPRSVAAQRAVEEAEAIARVLGVLDPSAEATKTLFRSATLGGGPEPGEVVELPVHTCPPALLRLTHDGPAPQPGSGAALVQRQV